MCTRLCIIVDMSHELYDMTFYDTVSVTSTDGMSPRPPVDASCPCGSSIDFGLRYRCTGSVLPDLFYWRASRHRYVSDSRWIQTHAIIQKNRVMRGGCYLRVKFQWIIEHIFPSVLHRQHLDEATEDYIHLQRSHDQLHHGRKH